MGTVTCTWAPLLALGRRAAGAPVLHHELQQPTWASHPFSPRDSQSLQTTLVCGANKEVLGSAELQQLVWRWPWKNIHQEFNPCFFPVLPFLKHIVPGSSQLCRAQSGRMVHGTWVLVWGDVGYSPLPCRVHLSPMLLQPGLLGTFCCSGTGKGRDWQTGLGPVAPPSTPRLWHSLVLLHAHGCALCFGKPCWKCSGQCLSPTHTWALSPCGSSKLSHSKCQGRMGLSLLPLALPWCSPASSHCSEAFGCSWLSLTCYSHHSFCMVRPFPGKARKAQWFQ